MNIYEKLQKIQEELKAPKRQFNKFGNYAYRSCEDILEGLKPLLAEYKATLIIGDVIELVGDRFYVVATVRLIDIEKQDSYVEVKASAREALTKKGMDESQITGSTSSYARKYALNGMFAIDDTKDPDSQDNRDASKKTNKSYNKQAETPKPTLIDKTKIDTLEALAKQIDADLKKTLEYYKVKEVKDLTVTQWTSIITKMKAKKEEMTKGEK